GFSERLADRSIRLEILAKGSETSCFCDAEALSRVISILLENAIRFAPTGSAISCTLNPTVIERDEELLRALEIAVADEGIGIPANELESIFDAFTQSSLTKDGSGGTGLGLTIARAIVTAHGGTIVAQNRAGGGATLRVTLPAEEEPSTNVEPTTEPSCASAPA
ncbi:MAG TPA: ATP-binding protein, partial [Planctomycetota bacterium]|nr:ATP-binding protein [Planctomycetota bacterium]